MAQGMLMLHLVVEQALQQEKDVLCVCVCVCADQLEKI